MKGIVQIWDTVVFPEPWSSRERSLDLVDSQWADVNWA